MWKAATGTSRCGTIHGEGPDHPRKRACLTAGHNFFLTRADGTTAAERFPGRNRARCLRRSWHPSRYRQHLSVHRSAPWARPEGYRVANAVIRAGFLIGETHRGQQWTPGLDAAASVLRAEPAAPRGILHAWRGRCLPSEVQRQLLRNELAKIYHHPTCKCIPPRKLR